MSGPENSWAASHPSAADSENDDFGWEEDDEDSDDEELRSIDPYIFDTNYSEEVETTSMNTGAIHGLQAWLRALTP